MKRFGLFSLILFASLQAQPAEGQYRPGRWCNASTMDFCVSVFDLRLEEVEDARPVEDGWYHARMEAAFWGAIGGDRTVQGFDFTIYYADGRAHNMAPGLTRGGGDGRVYVFRDIYEHPANEGAFLCEGSTDCPAPGTRQPLLSDISNIYFADGSNCRPSEYTGSLANPATPACITVTPEPETWLMLATGLLGIAWVGRRRVRGASDVSTGD